jgi:methionyl-tRNA formyltransferase
MLKETLSIVYMGTPDFAVAPLKALVEGGYRVVGVVTMPDKPAGRGMQLQSSPVKDYALSQGLPLLQPEKLKEPTFLQALQALQSDLFIVVAFRMLPEVVWSMPRFGTFNLHASLLPQYRGAAPIHWAVINGETKTGVTTFLLQHTIDTGDILLQAALPIGEDECTGSVHDRLMVLGSELVLRTVNLFIEGKAKPQPQAALADVATLKPAPKLFKDNTRIDWSCEGKAVFNWIRGLSPYPAAWTTLVPVSDTAASALTIKVFEATFEAALHDRQPGTILTDAKSFLKVAVPGGFILLKRLQSAGRKAMSVDAWLRGFSGVNDWMFV